jgi:hypothetical protein
MPKTVPDYVSHIQSLLGDLLEEHHEIVDGLKDKISRLEDELDDKTEQLDSCLAERENQA